MDTKNVKNKKCCSICKILFKTAKYLGVGLFGGFFLVWSTVSLIKYPLYSEFYSIRESLGDIPGIYDGFIPQGICVNEDLEITLMTGYQFDKTKPSNIYVVDKENNYRNYEIVNKDGSLYNGHNSAIANTGNTIYISDCENNIHILDLNDLLDTSKKTIAIKDTIHFEDNSCSFVFSNDTKLIVGEFNYGKRYITNHPYETASGTHKAIAEEFDINDLSKPTKVYSIQDKAQGFAVNDDGDILISTSWGTESSEFFYYRVEDIKKSEHTYKDAPVYFLDNPYKTLKAPAMTEDLDYSNGKWITYTETSSNLYLLGRLFYAEYYYQFIWDF